MNHEIKSYRLGKGVFMSTAGSSLAELMDNCQIMELIHGYTHFSKLADKDIDHCIAHEAQMTIHHSLNLCTCNDCLESDKPCKMDCDTDSLCSGCRESMECEKDDDYFRYLSSETHV